MSRGTPPGRGVPKVNSVNNVPPYDVEADRDSTGPGSSGRERRIRGFGLTPTTLQPFLLQPALRSPSLWAIPGHPSTRLCSPQRYESYAHKNRETDSEQDDSETADHKSCQPLRWWFVCPGVEHDESKQKGN